MADCNWNTAVEDIGEHAELSYDDLDDGRKPSRPLDFPAPVSSRRFMQLTIGLILVYKIFVYHLISFNFVIFCMNYG